MIGESDFRSGIQSNEYSIVRNALDRIRLERQPAVAESLRQTVF